MLDKIEVKKFEGDSRELSAIMTAPSNGFFIGYLFASSGGSGTISGTITRGGQLQFKLGLSVQYSGSVVVPNGSYCYPAKQGDVLTYDRTTQGNVEGGVGFYLS